MGDALDPTTKVGSRYGRLLVVGRAPNDYQRRAVWICQCDCGSTRNVAGGDLRRGRVSCGCIGIESRTRHGHAAGGISPEYKSWRAMLARCHTETATGYAAYGGRGITVCERWREDFRHFLADMGPRPPGTSIDRIDGSKGYEPSNCRWATRLEQSRNRNGVKLSLDDAKEIVRLVAAGESRRSVARRFGVSASSVERIALGIKWPDAGGGR